MSENLMGSFDSHCSVD